jgi:hypothetical protein
MVHAKSSGRPFHRATATATRILRYVNAHKRLSGYLYFDISIQNQGIGIVRHVSPSSDVLFVRFACSPVSYSFHCTVSEAQSSRNPIWPVYSARLGHIASRASLSAWRKARQLFECGERAVRVPPCLTVLKV